NVNGIYVTEARTWFQTEAHATTRKGDPLAWVNTQGLSDTAAHVADFGCYQASAYWAANGQKMKVGPRRDSDYTEGNRLQLNANVPQPNTVILDTDDNTIGALWNNKIIPVHAIILCQTCGEHKQGLTTGVTSRWHRCTTCRRWYCSGCGGQLARPRLLAPTRPAARGASETELG